MSNFRIILRALGLNQLKVVRYQGRIGEELPAGAASDFPTQTAEAGTRLVSDGADADVRSYLGTPVFSDIAIQRDGQTPLKLETVLIDVSQSKNIVTTAVQGRNGTIKEYIADGDYEITIRGALVNPLDENYPIDQVRDLHQVLLQSDIIDVVSDYLRIFEIYSIVVTSYRFFQQEGFQNMQLFEIQALSDAPVELISEDDV